MAWTSEKWQQHDDFFYSYPVPVPVTDFPLPVDKSVFPNRWIFDDAFYSYPHTLPLTVSPGYIVKLIFGSEPVPKAYLGTELVWETGGINKIILGRV